MFAWGKIAVAGVILFTGTVISVDAGFIGYNASGSVLTTNVVDYGNYTKCDRQVHFKCPIPDLSFTTEKPFAFQGFRGPLSCFSHDTHFQLVRTGFGDGRYGHNLVVNRHNEAEIWRNSHLRDNYRFPCTWRYHNTNHSRDIETTTDNCAAVPEPSVQNFIVLGLVAMFLIPAGILRTRPRFTESE